MSVEKVPVRIYKDDKQASKAVAIRIAEIIRAKADAGEQAVLGLATGHTPVNIYTELIRMHRAEGLDFSNVVTFNLDEYWPISHDAIQSYHQWMHENLFKHVNIPAENIHVPSGEVSEDDLEAGCRQYEEAIAAAGGIDLQLLGIGRSGHVGFNEPGSARDSLTRRVVLDRVTRKDAASDFFGEENVPDMAITMGVGSILAAREICLLAFGEHKAPIIKRAVEGEVTRGVAASFMQQHGNVTFYIDESASAELTRIATPWLVARCEWDEILTRRAVIWLATKLEKPILKLTDEDYAENSLHRLMASYGGAYDLNLKIFKRMMKTISGWPAGKGEKKRIVILSPHPDDDVISMGGTLMRLVEQGHDVHVVYMVSGFLSVFDHTIARYADFVNQFNGIFDLVSKASTEIDHRVDEFLRSKRPGDIDIPEVQAIKGLVRKAEAIDAATYSGVAEKNIHFLNMPFYNTGTVQKLSIGVDDIAAIRNLLDEVKPEIIFAAGDMSDPHGTHRLCQEANLIALDDYVKAGNDQPELWYYRGAWQEWAPEEIDMAVPFSPDELKRKRFAIFRHESQKDRAMFPGPYDSREFWQRSEDRNKASAVTYDNLGMPEYHAIEAFVRYPIERSAHTASQLTKV